ncbi:MucBP domain-containing protein [Lactococcus lactis subsp. lactis]|uniref:MucBP domain-containing protein n=5 Tax=Lactococcus lactis TaxID=1358 RepID=A0AAC9R342_LACLL|nr:MucBP domain-containing protein [Lactococcus lactis]ARD97272.1 MucBP domain-containing protein [Lactococcus lactis subsp. lactis]ARE09562.1 MucBP domain-containing protein [Lactococcus lactis subsp. lactis]ARR87593.1 internalin [Lactococcus lactis subsp. lactis bv. diacetylactis]EQC53508.1 internalin [Lactococcus lactis subsp. lactis bv. diacetylactis str. TIFN2]EQC85473.1 internalin [Lactococcus lactis subsp. lactis bv. diacetylactis str. TIFN4]
MNKKSSALLTMGTLTLLADGGVVLTNLPDSFKIQRVYAATSRDITVYSKDFLTYFQRNGSAAGFDYDLATYTQTLTPDLGNQAGNVTLKTKVDMSQNFTFTGQINLGNKSQQNGGADGVGFLFHPGDTSVVGAPGGAAGIGGVNGAFGFKLDTYYNGVGETSFTPDPSAFSGKPFGAFVDGLNGQAKTISASAKGIPQPSNNNFVDFTMSYNGTTKVMSITYGGQTWTQNVSSFIGTNQAMSFSIAASTGAQMNLQQLRNVNFTYTVAQGTVIANYVDEQGNTIAQQETTSGDIDTPYVTSQKTIPGYTFKASNGAATSGNYAANDQTVNYVYTRNQGSIDVTYIDQTTGQTLSKKDLSGGTGDSSNYTTTDTIKSYTDAGYELVSDNYPSGGTVFTDTAQHYVVNLKQKLVVSSEQKQVNETIQYVYEDGSKAADDYNAPPLNFTRSVTTNQVTGEKTYGDWQAQNGDSFGEVVSPTIKGETADQLKIDAISGITANSADIQKKVVYKRNQGTIDVTYIDETTGQVLTKKDLSGGTDDPSNYTTADDIKSYTDKGYELVSDDYPSGGTVFTDEPQHYVVKLKHGLTESTDKKAVNQVIHYVYEGGGEAATDHNATVDFSRTITTDRVTNDKTYGDWTADNGDSFASVTSPVIDGYTADQLKVSEMTGITADTEDISVTVTYTRNQGTIDITYIDQTTGQTLSKKDLSGGTGDDSGYTTADTIKSYTDKGYELISDDYPEDGTKFADDPQHYIVRLKHGLTEVTENKTVNQVIHYVYEGGGEAATDHNATVVFSQTITTDKVTGEKTYSDWTADNGDSFASVTSPVIDGYTADQLKVSEMTGITVDTEDISVTVTYTRNQGTIDVTYIDETTGKILTTKDLSGGTGDDSGYTTADTIKSYTDKGYELVSNDYPEDGTKFADDPQHYIVRLKHGTVVETENKSVNEVIHYVYDNGDKAADNYKATIVFSRTITTDKVTGEKTYSDWTADNGGRFAAVLSPIIKDYIASQLKVDEMTGITVDTADIERIVVYHKVPAGIIVPPVHPDKPSQPSNNQSKIPTAKAVKDSKPTDVLPSTGDSQKSQIVLTLLGIMAVIISPLALLLRRRKQ